MGDIILEKVNYKLINIFLIIISLFLSIKTFYLYKPLFSKIFDILFSIIFSFLISYSLYPCIKILNKHFNYKKSCLLVLTIVFILLLVFLYISITIFKREIPLISNSIISFSSKLSFFDLIKKYFSLDKGLILISNGTNILIKIIVILVLIICFVFNMDSIIQRLLKYELFRMINNDLYNYYRGFYLVTIIEIVEYFIIYLIIGHPYYLFLSFLSGFSNIVPSIGALFTNFIALIASFNISKGLFIKTSIVMIAIPLFNNYYIEPKIYNKALKVSFLSIVLVVLISAKVLGFFGVLFAIPFYIIIKNTIVIICKKRELS